MKHLLSSFFVFIQCVVAFAYNQNDTIFTVQLVALRTQDPIPELLVEPLEAKGFKQREQGMVAEDSSVFVFNESLYYTKEGDSLNLIVSKFCYGKFKTYTEALDFFKQDSVRSNYFSKASIADLTTDSTGKQHLSPYVLKASDKFMEPFVNGIETV